MIAKIACSTSKLIVTDIKGEFLGFQIYNDYEFIKKEMLTESFLKTIGTFHCEAFKSHPFFYREAEFNSETSHDLTESDTRMLQENVTVYYSALERFITFLWFIKDNACSINSFNVYLPDAKRAIIKPGIKDFSTCQGDSIVITSFTAKEVDRAMEIYLKAIKYYYHNNVKEYNVDETLPPVFTKREIIPFNYKKVSRIERAVHFLELAREAKLLPLKISFYICIYETLFSGAGGEISHQVCERAALYFSKTRHITKGVYQQLRDAYTIRNIYFHGSSFKKVNTDLSKMCHYLDNITRHIFYTVIMEDVDVFTQNHDSREKAFRDLIFQDYRVPDSITFEGELSYKRFKERTYRDGHPH